MRRGEAFNFEVHHADIVWGEIWYFESPGFILDAKLMGTIIQRQTQSPYVKNYDFDYPQTRVSVTFTCVSGHLLAFDFDKDYKSGARATPSYSSMPKSNHLWLTTSRPLPPTFRRRQKKCQQLMIWTDCDREERILGLRL